jgi:hypothetical protein
MWLGVLWGWMEDILRLIRSMMLEDRCHMAKTVVGAGGRMFG